MGAVHRLGLRDRTQAKRSSLSLHPSLPRLHDGADRPRSGVWNQTDSLQNRNACFNYAAGLLCGARSLLLLCQRRAFNSLQPLFFGIILCIALGASIAFDCAHWFDHVISGPVVALWTSFVMHNLMAIAKTLQETEGIYAMLKIQADVTVLIRAHC